MAIELIASTLEHSKDKAMIERALSLLQKAPQSFLSVERMSNIMWSSRIDDKSTSYLNCENGSGIGVDSAKSFARMGETERLNAELDAASEREVMYKVRLISPLSLTRSLSPLALKVY